MAKHSLFPRKHGTLSDKVMRGTNHKPLITTKDGQPWKGIVRMRPETIEERSSLSQRPTEIGVYDIAPDGQIPYVGHIPTDVVGTKQFAAALENLLPPGCRVNDEDHATSNAILALSFAPEFYPTFERDFDHNEQGALYHGEVIATFYPEIVSESKNQFHETVYRMRSNGRYFDITADELLAWEMGSLGRAERSDYRRHPTLHGGQKGVRQSYGR